MDFSAYTNCHLCPRDCGVDRTKAVGACGMNDTLSLSRAALHYWEEPCISGTRGSGTVFFSGCSLRCVFCQNREISRGDAGLPVSVSRLSDIFLELEEKGAHNINLVTPTHYLPHIAAAAEAARKNGLSIPFVYNTSGYEKEEIVEFLQTFVDIFMPDYKYYSPILAARYSHAADYPDIAFRAISAMVRAGDLSFDEDGLLRRGTLVRILLLPGALIDAKAILHRLYTAFGNRIALSLMRQYTPPPDMKPPLDRRVSDAEYKSFVTYAQSLGFRNAYIQEKESVGESFIPAFDYTGVLPEKK